MANFVLYIWYKWIGPALLPFHVSGTNAYVLSCHVQNVLLPSDHDSCIGVRYLITFGLLSRVTNEHKVTTV